MMKWEAKLRDWLSQNVILLGYAAVFLLGAFIRWSYLPHLAADLEFMNSSWFEAIKEGGMGAVLDPALQYTYSPLHLYMWTVAAKLFGGFDTHVVLKLLSLAFEALTVGAGWLLVRAVLPQERKAMGSLVGFAMLWLSPMMIWNVAAWGQTDVCFAVFGVLAVLLLIRDKPEWALCCLGVALAWKLQAIFLLPLFVMAWFCGNKRFSLLWFLAVPGILLLSGVPMMLVGESPMFAVNIYLGQTDLYTEITYNCPNLYALMGKAIGGNKAILGMFSRTGMVLCIGALGMMLVWLTARRAKLAPLATFASQAKFAPQATVLLGAWCVFCCVFFLPRMHERYAIVGELLLICWAVSLNKPRGYAYVLIELLPTLSAYAKYMYREPFFSLQIGGFINLTLLCALTWETVRAFSGDADAAASMRTAEVEAAP